MIKFETETVCGPLYNKLMEIEREHMDLQYRENATTVLYKYNVHVYELHVHVCIIMNMYMYMYMYTSVHIIMTINSSLHVRQADTAQCVLTLPLDMLPLVLWLRVYSSPYPPVLIAAVKH